MIKFQKPLSEIDYIISFDLALYKTGVSIYDISQKSIVRTDKIEVLHTDETPKPTKTDIKKAVCAHYGLKTGDLTDDESDSVAVIYTLIKKKWNADLKDEIKRIKKEMKGLKQERAIAAHEKRIEELQAMILEVE